MCIVNNKRMVSVFALRSISCLFWYTVFVKKLSYFTETVRKLAKSIPKGKVTTYGLLARAAGGGGQAARSVTSVLAKDPDYKKIPFHRIVYAGGKVWTNTTCAKDRIKILRAEGVPVKDAGIIENFRDYLYLDNE